MPKKTKVNLINPFEREENLASWFEKDKFYKASLNKGLADFKSQINYQSTFGSSVKNFYLKVVHSITQHAIVATLIMFVALGSVGASAAELLAPQDYKPSTFIQNTFNANKQAEKDPYTALEPDQNNNVVKLDSCNLAIKYPKILDEKRLQVYQNLTPEQVADPQINQNGLIDSVLILPLELEKESGKVLYNRISCHAKTDDKDIIVNSKAENLKKDESFTVENLRQKYGWFVTEGELQSLLSYKTDTTLRQVVNYVVFDFQDRTYLIETFSKFDQEINIYPGVFGDQYQLQFNSLVGNKANQEITVPTTEQLEVINAAFAPVRPSTSKIGIPTGRLKKLNGEDIFYYLNDGLGGFYSFIANHRDPLKFTEVWIPSEMAEPIKNLNLKKVYLEEEGGPFLTEDQPTVKLYGEIRELRTSINTIIWEMIKLEKVELINQPPLNSSSTPSTGFSSSYQSSSFYSSVPAFSYSLKPKNSSLIKYDNIDFQYCGYGGWLNYYTADYNNDLFIISRKLFTDGLYYNANPEFYNLRSFDSAKNFVATGQPVYSGSNYWLGLFNPSCSGFSSEVIEHSEISYPGLEKARSVWAIEGQGIYGSLVVRIFGYKGDEMVSITKVLPVGTDSSIQACSPSSSSSFSSSSGTYYYYDDVVVDWACIKNKVQADPYYRNLYTNAVGQLKSLFAF